MSEMRKELGSDRKRALARLLVIAALAPVAVFGGAGAAYGQASVEAYTDPGGSSQNDVPPGGDVLGEGDAGGGDPGTSTRYICPPGTVGANGGSVASGPSGEGCVERGGGGDPGVPREAGGGEPSASSGSLPFTGVDLAAIGGVGLLLAGLGFGLRRLTSTQPGS